MRLTVLRSRLADLDFDNDPTGAEVGARLSDNLGRRLPTNEPGAIKAEINRLVQAGELKERDFGVVPTVTPTGEPGDTMAFCVGPDGVAFFTSFRPHDDRFRMLGLRLVVASE